MVKINKKDKLAAMLQMWTILKSVYPHRPWSNESNEYKLMIGLQTELAIMLGVPLKPVAKPLLPRDQIALLVENLEKVEVELKTLKNADNSHYEGSTMLSALIGMLEDKLKPVPVPANFDEKMSEKVAKAVKEGELPSPESEYHD